MLGGRNVHVSDHESVILYIPYPVINVQPIFTQPSALQFALYPSFRVRELFCIYAFMYLPLKNLSSN